MASALVPWVSCLLLVAVSGVQAQVLEGCVKCLCEAVSGGPWCRYGEGCHDGVCGPYSITQPYWQDAGRPTVGLEDRQSHTAYENCALDQTCAEATIRGYMNKFHQDCNGDGVESCEDYAAIHFHGGYGCNKPLREQARTALTSCLLRQGSGGSVPAVPPPSPGPARPNQFIPAEPNSEGNNLEFPDIDIRFGESETPQT